MLRQPCTPYDCDCESGYLKEPVKANLGKHSDLRFGENYSKSMVKEEDRIGFDLAVLATSDHSIHTVG